MDAFPHFLQENFQPILLLSGIGAVFMAAIGMKKLKRRNLSFSGKHFDEDVDCHENGNFDFLMGLDVDVNDLRVKEELTNWGLVPLKKPSWRLLVLMRSNTFLAAYWSWLKVICEKSVEKSLR